MSRVQELKRNLSLALQDSSWGDALAVLGKLVEVEGSQPAYHNQIGDILLKSGRREEAMESFMRGIHAYRDLGMYPNGAALCKKVLRLDPEQREAIWVLGELKARQGFLADGAENMLEALRGFSEEPDFGRDNLLVRLASAEELLAGNREVLEFIATSYARMEEPERARAATLRIADLEDREGNREKASELRRLAQELTQDGAAVSAPQPVTPPPAEPAPQSVTPPPAVAERPEAAEEAVDLVETEPETPTLAPDAVLEVGSAEADVAGEVEALEPPAADASEPDTVEAEAPQVLEAKPLPEPEAPQVLEAKPLPEPEAPTVDIAPDLAPPSAVLDEILGAENDDAVDPEEPAETLLEISVPPATQPVDDPDASLPPGSRVNTEAADSGDEDFESFTISATSPGSEAAPAPAAAAEDEAARLAESMLEQMAAGSELPEVELLGETADETDSPPDALGPEPSGAGSDDGEDGNAARLSELMTTRPSADVARAGDVELLNISDSLAEADGDWDKPAAPSEDAEPAAAHHEIHLDDTAQPLSFGLTTTAGEALQTDDIDEVVGEFRRRMKEQMGSMAPEERYQLGVSYMEMGLHEEALEEFEHTLEHKVLGAKTREWMARCLLAMERPREIVLLLQTRLDSESYPQKSMVELYFLLGEAYEKLQAYDLALDAFTKVYQLDPEFREVQGKLAKLTNA